MDDAETPAAGRRTCPICAHAHHPDAQRVTTSYRSIVLHIPATPLGLLGERWAVDHCCNLCRQRVAPAELIVHAQRHEHAAHLPTAKDKP